MRAVLISVFILAVLALLACEVRQTAEAPPPINGSPALDIVTTSYPVHYFAQRLAPDTDSVTFIVPEGVDPAYWEPETADIERMQAAGLLLLNGATLEKWRDWVTLPEERVVETANAFHDEWIMAEDAVVHSHGPGHMHAHGEVDFNTWLDPQLAIRQAEAITRELARRQGTRLTNIDQRLNELRAELEALDERFESITQQIGDRPLLASHPVYDYFARRYQLNLRSFHWEPDEHPDDEEWTALDALLADHPATLMLWEGEPLPETATALAQRGITPIVFQTAANQPDQGDYMQTMHANAQRLADAR